MEWIASLSAWTSWVSTGTVGVGGLRARPHRKTTAFFPVPGQFLCLQHSLKLQNRYGQMQQQHEGSLADTMPLWLSPQRHSDLHTSALAVIFLLYMCMWFWSYFSWAISQCLLSSSAPQPVGRASSHEWSSVCTRSPGATAMSALSCPSQRPTGSATKRSAMRR